MKRIYQFIILGSILILTSCEESELTSFNSIEGKGGSLARFTISNDHLYAVSSEKLKPFSIADPWNPQKQEEIILGREIETIFSYQNHLFIGSQTGMHIYNIDDPQHPSYVSSYSHVRTCDPVVIQGNYAYVTLRANVECGGAISELDIIDISDITLPKEVKSISMQSPHGLGIDGDKLFVCEGENGIQAFDASDPVQVEKDTLYENHHAVDVILNNGTMIVTGMEGIFQYNYKNADTLQFLSQIKIHDDE